MPDETLLKLLLLEDDPVSQAFLHEVLLALPAEVDCASTCAAAESMARAGAYALWIFDANLPDGSGADLLCHLRTSGRTTPAIALTAESFRDRLDALSDAGFSAVLQKPISAGALQTAIRNQLCIPASAESTFEKSLGFWDENQALAAVGGRIESARALRDLFLEELPTQAETVRTAFHGSDYRMVREQLHRLKASCGFVGADRLLSAVNRLSTEMDASSLQAFLDVASLQRQAPMFTLGAA